MSHFSKIKTNIYDDNVLVKTLNDMGFICKYSMDSLSSRDIFVYNTCNADKYLFVFTWNGSFYNLLADLQLWSLDIDFHYFMDSLSQMYAYNIILNQGFLSGFNKVGEKTVSDGSIKIKLKKWSSSDCY
uniref:Ycf35 n=1 Tax=Laurencia catarinensis TaxID=197326 RepID=UPI0028D0CE85|nr:Ycf35 [Laurencia catarinensis]WMP12397.1 Ycf35 [Laurencia catarinensis]